MNARIRQTLADVQSSYWFIPSLMTLGAGVLALGLPVLDASLGSDWVERFGWAVANRPEGARALLSTVAGSMIGVAGVTFSVTIAAVSYAAGQYGPRLLTNFLRDRGNQVTLGTFVATFLYSLLVLRTVRSAEDVGAEFVPHLSVLVGVGFAVASIAVLIFFIHHASESIHISRVIARIGGSLEDGMRELFPSGVGRPERGTTDDAQDGPNASDTDGLDALPDDFASRARAVRANSSGYLQSVDAESLLATASERDLVLRLLVGPGDFVGTAKPLALVYPADRLTDDAETTISEAFAWGWQRTPEQDVRFLADELVEIAARALSAGVNDPFTAISCLHWLGAALGLLAGQPPISGVRCDADGRVRLVAAAASFAQFAETVFGQLRPYVRADRNAALHTFAVLAAIAERASTQECAVLQRHADALLEGCEEALGQDADRAEVRERHRTVVGLLSGRLDWASVASETAWIGGRS